MISWLEETIQNFIENGHGSFKYLLLSQSLSDSCQVSVDPNEALESGDVGLDDETGSDSLDFEFHNVPPTIGEGWDLCRIS